MTKLSELDLAVKFLKEGKLIAFPTETVYALAGDARNLLAIKQIFRLKNRPLNQPLSVLLAENQPLELWAREISPLAKKLAQQFWPGPLTLILNKNESVLSELTAGQPKIGLRIPNHPIAQAFLQAFGDGLAATSANRSTHFSATEVDHVREAFRDQLALITDGGPCSIGIESTIIDVTTDIPQILRLGAISVARIQKVIGVTLIKAMAKSNSNQLGSRIVLQQVLTEQLDYMISEHLRYGKTLIVLGLNLASIHHKNLTWITMPNNPIEYARILYKILHEAEQHASDKILVESLPNMSVWAGVQAILDKNSI